MRRNFAFGFSAVAALMVLAGCRHETLEVTLASRAFLSGPQPPPILTTAAGALLTNNAGFSAKVNIDGVNYTGSGTLLGYAGKLVFEPDSEKGDKNTPAGRYRFIWDIAKGQGTVLSDALQGWAPMTLSSQGTATNVVITGSVLAQTSGTALTSLRADLTDGRELQFTASQGPGGVPLQIQGGNPAFNATLTKVSLKAPDPGMFKVPEGFTAYSSPEVMVDEMAARFRNLRRKSY